MRAAIKKTLVLLGVSAFTALFSMSTPCRADSDERIQPHYTFPFKPLTPEKHAALKNPYRFDPNDDYSGLPRTGAYELVDAYCSGCHSLQIVMQQRASEARWKELLLWMSEKQNMPPLEDDEQNVLRYLATHFGDQ